MCFISVFDAIMEGVSHKAIVCICFEVENACHSVWHMATPIKITENYYMTTKHTDVLFH